MTEVAASLSDPDMVEFLGDDTEQHRRRTLFVSSARGALRLRGTQIVATTPNQTLEVPLRLLERIVLIGNVALSAPLRSHALRNGPDVVFLSRSGDYLGRLDTGQATRARMSQLAFVAVAEHRLRLARSIVAAKVRNQRRLLLRYSRRNGEPAGESGALLRSATDRLSERVEAVGSAATIESVLGHEGTAARHYFAGLASLVPPDLGFRGRTGRHATDPVNAAMNFGYALLLAETCGAVAAVGLDPGVGALHEMGNRPALALDLMEEFRPILVDAVVVDAFRRRRLTAPDFRRIAGVTRFTEEGRRVFLGLYERRLRTSFRSRGSRAATYRHHVRRQALRLRSSLCDDRPYQALEWR